MKINSYRAAAWAMLVLGAVALLGGVFMLQSVDTSRDLSRTGSLTMMGSIVFFLFGLPSCFLGYSLTKRRSWARFGSIGLFSFLLLTQLKVLGEGGRTASHPLVWGSMLLSAYFIWCLVTGWEEQEPSR